MSLGALSPDAGGKVSQRQRIGCDRAVFPSAGGDGYGGLGRGLGLRGAAHQQPQEPPQCHRGLPLAAGQNQGRPGTWRCFGFRVLHKHTKGLCSSSILGNFV